MYYVCCRELCDCVEAILIPSGDRIKDLVEEIFEVRVYILISHCLYIHTYVCTYTMYAKHEMLNL